MLIDIGERKKTKEEIRQAKECQASHKAKGLELVFEVAAGTYRLIFAATFCAWVKSF